MDVLIDQTLDGGEIEITNGKITLDNGLTSAVYLSLFGGNFNENGLPAPWWGRTVEQEYVSKTQEFLTRSPASSANLKKLKLLVETDLAWLFKDKIVEEIIVEVVIPAYNQVKIDITVNGFEMKYSLPWSAA